VLKERINILLFIIPICIIGLVNLAFPHKAMVSELENRSLARLPAFSSQSLFSGRFTMELENFVADHFLMRDRFVVWSHDAKELFKPKTDGENVEIIVNKGVNVADGAAEPGEDLQGVSPVQESDPLQASSVSGMGTDSVSHEEDAGWNRETNGQPQVSMAATDSPGGDSATEAPNAEIAGEKAAAPASDGKEGQVSSTGEEGRERKNPSQSTPEAEKNNSNENEETRTGGVLIVGNRAMEIYKFNQAPADNYAGKLIKFAGGLENVKVYSLLAPTQIEFVKSEKYKNISDSQKQGIDYVYGELGEKVMPVDAYTPLKENSDKYVYFRTDHHWTALGAYYAYTGFCSAAGLEPLPLDRYEQGEVPDFLGSLYTITLSKALRNNPDTIRYYKPPVRNTYHVYYEGATKIDLIDLNRAKDKNKYRIFISGDRPMGKVVSENKNGKKILVIKDSYGNAFVPFLVPHYEEVYVIDPRQYKNSVKELIQKEGIQEVLFLNYALITNNAAYAKLLDELH
jgi:hypothetical protein